MAVWSSEHTSSLHPSPPDDGIGKGPKCCAISNWPGLFLTAWLRTMCHDCTVHKYWVHLIMIISFQCNGIILIYELSALLKVVLNWVL